MTLTKAEARERIARRLLNGPGGRKRDRERMFAQCVNAWSAGKTFTSDHYRDPFTSHDTIHAVEATLTDEEWERYLRLVRWAHPKATGIAKHFRRAPADVLAMALGEVIGGEDE